MNYERDIRSVFLNHFFSLEMDHICSCVSEQADIYFNGINIATQCTFI